MTTDTKTLEELSKITFGVPKFPHNKSLPRLGNNRGHVSKNTRNRRKAIARESQLQNRP